MSTAMGFSRVSSPYGDRDLVASAEHPVSNAQKAENYVHRNGSHFGLSSLHRSPAEREWALRSSQEDCSAAGVCGGGRGRGEYAPVALDGFLPTLTAPQGWSVATINHPTVAAVHRFHEEARCANPARRIERVPVGYRLAPYHAGGVASQPVGFRIRVDGGPGCRLDPALLDPDSGVALKVTEIPPHHYVANMAPSVLQGGGTNSSLFAHSSGTALTRHGLSSLVAPASHLCPSTASRLLLSPLLQEVDLCLRRQALGALSDIWAASPAAKDDVLTQAGFNPAQRETILWELERMALVST